MKVDQIGEFGLIARVAESFRDLIPSGYRGIGDDCAVIPIGGGRSMVVTADMLVEGSHFLMDDITAWDLGYKSMAVNTSDIAAMGAKPTAAFLSIALTEGCSVEWCEQFFEGIHAHGVPLLGGDTTKSKHGIVINITVLGEASDDHLKYRSSASVSDCILVTAPLGDSAAGLRAILSKIDRKSDTVERLISAHYHPRSYLSEGLWLGTRGEVHAMMDISDGVASDLRHILRLSQVGAKVELSSIPLSDDLHRVCSAHEWNPLELALCGGEDYALLLTADPIGVEQLKADYRAQFGADLYQIGVITKEDGLVWTNHGQEQGLSFAGFSHF